MKKKFKSMQEVAESFWKTNDISLYINNGSKAGYDDEPVYWCSVCKSLHIIRCDSPLDTALECYCADCGSIDMVSGSIDEWLVVQDKNKIIY